MGILEFGGAQARPFNSSIEMEHAPSIDAVLLKTERTRLKSVPATLDDALGTHECPVCATLGAEEFNFMISLTSHCYRTGHASRDLIARRLCNFHVWEIGKLAGPDTFAQILIDLLETEEILQMDGSPPHETAQPWPLRREETCVACDYKEDRESFWTKEFVDRLQNGDFISHYLQSVGLCLNHLARALSLLGSQEVTRVLVDHARGEIKKLAERLISLRAEKEFRRFGSGHVLAMAAQELFGRRGQRSGAVPVHRVNRM